LAYSISYRRAYLTVQSIYCQNFRAGDTHMTFEYQLRPELKKSMSHMKGNIV